MQLPSSSLTSTVSLPTAQTHTISMEAGQLFPCESFSYSLRLSFDSESFIEFDPRLMSLRWSIKAQGEEASDSSLDLDSILTSSLFSRSNRHESHGPRPAPSVPASPASARGSQIDGRVSTHRGFGLALQKYLCLVVMKLCRRMKGMRLPKRTAGKPKAKAATAERGRGKRVFDADTASCIQDAVLHCKNSNLSSLMEEDC